MEYPHASGLAARLFPRLFLLAVISVLPSAAAEGAMREYESEEGRLRIVVVAVAPPDAEAPGACLSAESIGDFASPSGICRSGDALLDVDFHDKAAMRELRFPLKYSELRRYLLKHPLAYREGTAEERAVRLIADLARDLRIEMRDSPQPEEKP